jgi:hypothetical protein
MSERYIRVLKLYNKFCKFYEVALAKEPLQLDVMLLPSPMYLFRIKMS